MTEVLIFLSILIACGLCVGVHALGTWWAGRAIIIDPHTPGAFIRRKDIVEEDYSDRQA